MLAFEVDVDTEKAKKGVVIVNALIVLAILLLGGSMIILGSTKTTGTFHTVATHI